MSTNQKLSKEELGGAVAMLQRICERLQQQGLDVPKVSAELTDNEQLLALVDAVHKAVGYGKILPKPGPQQKPTVLQEKSAGEIAAKVIEYIKKTDMTNVRQNQQWVQSIAEAVSKELSAFNLRMPKVVVKENPANERLIMMVESIHEKLFPSEKKSHPWWKIVRPDADGISFFGLLLPWRKCLWGIGILIAACSCTIFYYVAVAERYKAGYVKYTLVKMYLQEEKPAASLFQRLDSTYCDSDKVDERLEYFEREGWE